MAGDNNEVEICYECYFFRHDTVNDRFLCVNPRAYWCDRNGIGKATRACEHAKPHDWRPDNIKREK